MGSARLSSVSPQKGKAIWIKLSHRSPPGADDKLVKQMTNADDDDAVYCSFSETNFVAVFAHVTGVDSEISSKPNLASEPHASLVDNIDMLAHARMQCKAMDLLLAMSETLSSPPDGIRSA